jgi:heme/copper-type cytochrome/quinol oxidase subunit 2
MKIILSKEFLIAIITINLSLAVIAPIFFLTYFNPKDPNSEIYSSQRNDLRNLLKNILLLPLIISILSIIFVDFFNSSENPRREEKIFQKKKNRNLSKFIRLIIIMVLLILTIKNIYDTINFLESTSAMNYVRSVSDSTSIKDTISITVEHVNNTNLTK